MRVSVSGSPAQTALVRVDAVDGVRALACLMIFTYHSWQFAGSPGWGPLRWIETFPSGVDLFMVLSGFCLYYPLARSPQRRDAFTVGGYARRRIRRIVPPYYAAILFCVLLPHALVVVYRAAGQAAQAQGFPSLANLVTHLTFTHSLFDDYWDGINGSFWSLGLEAQFYVLFPLLVYATRRRAVAAMAAAAALSLLYRVVVDVLVGHEDFPNDFLWTITGVGRWMQFIAGMAAATVVVRGVSSRRVGAGLLGAAAVLLYVLSVALPDVIGHLPVRDVLVALGYASLLVAVCQPGPLGRAFGSRPAVSLGVMSYSVFLVHQPTVYYVQQGLERVLGVTDRAVTLVALWTLGLLVVLVVSRAFFLIAERPFITAPASPSDRAAP